MPTPDSVLISAESAGQTLAAVLRWHAPGQSWSYVKRLIDARQVLLNGEVCRDPARRVKEGDRVEVLTRPAAAPPNAPKIVLRHLDEHVVVAEKPAGMNTVRHPAELGWTKQRKLLTPTLQDLLPAAVNARLHRPPNAPQPRLRIVHRLDKETSGLVAFARSVLAERELGRQFKAHTVVRRYLAIIPGYLPPQRIETRLVRDRGDGRRGSTDAVNLGKAAVTHVDVVERLPGYTLLQCRLETGRTHQIRIHLAESGHPLCGESVYNRAPNGAPVPDASGAPRLALHAAELGFVHPATGDYLHWTMPLPADLQQFLERLRGKPAAATSKQRGRRDGN